MIELLKQNIETILNGKSFIREDAGIYSRMQYPKFLPLMNFYVDRYEDKGKLHLMIMHTKTKMGMELLTMSFMPQGITVPYLLIDAMTMKKTRCVFVEYYGCGREDFPDERLKEVHERYGRLPDYAEKENWYISERRPYSLIKTGEEEELLQMSADSVKAYLDCLAQAPFDPDYEKQLAAFRDRMIIEGNPSSKTLEMLLKKDGAVRFMKDVVMPIGE